MKRKAMEAPKKGELFRRIVPRKFMRLVQTEQMRELEFTSSLMPEYPPYHDDDDDGDNGVDGGIGSDDSLEGAEENGLDLSSISSISHTSTASNASVVSAMGLPPPSTAAEETPILAGSTSAVYTPSLRGGVRPSTASSTSSRVFSQAEPRRPPVPSRKGVESFLEGGEASFEPRYLLVDIRTEDEYDECHLDGAVSFPAARLSRSCNVYTPIMRSYKNRSDSVVIVYDNAEKRAPRVAQILYQQGFNNVVLLVGGLKSMVELFPSMILGSVPPDAMPDSPPDARRRRRRNASRPSSASSFVSSSSMASSRSRSRIHPDNSLNWSDASIDSAMSDLSRLPGYNARTKGNISAWH